MPEPIVDPEGPRTQTDGTAQWGLNVALRDGTEFKKRPHQLERIGDGGFTGKNNTLTEVVLWFVQTRLTSMPSLFIRYLCLSRGITRTRRK